MRPVILRVGMLLMGIGLLGGAAGTVLIESFKSIDEQVGTNGSAAAAVLGVGLIIAAFNPSGSVAWVRAGILYGIVVLIFEIISAVNHKGFHLGPVIFGLAFSLLLIAAYPERKKLLGDAAMRSEVIQKKEAEETPAVTPALEEPGPTS